VSVWPVPVCKHRLFPCADVIHPLAAGSIASPRANRFVESLFTAPVERNDWLVARLLVLFTLALGCYVALVPMMLVYVTHVGLPVLLAKLVAWTIGILLWICPVAAPVFDFLRRHKAEMMLLRRAGDGWSADDWQVFFDERAGIAEFDGGLPRARAEARALACRVVEWLNRNFVRSPPGRCLACDGGNHRHDPLLPFGIESTGHAWLHSRCWPTWHAGRKAEAIAALAAMGIAEPTQFPDDFGKNKGA